MIRLTRAVAAIAFLAALHGTAFAETAKAEIAPEATSGRATARLATAKQYMIAAANPVAVREGLKILEAGGSAVDALVTVQLVLGLVEPQSSGLGGGAFAMIHDAVTGKLHAYDGRETAPAAATPELFLGSDGKPLKFFDAVIGGRSVGTPGTVALLEMVHKKHGKLPWATLFEPAIRLASEGFVVSPRLNALISESAESLFANPATREYFLSEEAVPLFAGTVRKNPEYAEILRAIAEGGAQAFYSGAVAADIVATVTGAENPGGLSLADLAGYTPIEREPLCFAWRVYSICGMGPPSSGQTTIGQILGMIGERDLPADPLDPEFLRISGDASRLAFADRGLYIADPNFVKIPKGLLNPAYILNRAKLLETGSRLESAPAGEPPFDHALNLGPDRSPELPSTTHFSIVDGEGNLVSMTSTIENGFGSRLMTRGFLLNNELTDFSFVPSEDGKPVANRVEPGKRPRSSMAPTIVYKDGKPVLALGSPGGSAIIGYVAGTLVNILGRNMTLDKAVSAGHTINRFGGYDLEAGTEAESAKGALEAMGYKVRVTDMNSGLHVIAITPDGLLGAADPRREGVADGK